MLFYCHSGRADKQAGINFSRLHDFPKTTDIDRTGRRKLDFRPLTVQATVHEIISR